MADETRTMELMVTVDGIGPVPVTVTEHAGAGGGQVFLLLHGGAGPVSVDGFAGLLAGAGSTAGTGSSKPARVLVPTHPGFGGTERPAALDSIGALARVYVQLLVDLGLDDVTVIGNSIGGWIAAEIALASSPRVGRVVLVDAAGADTGHPGPDFFAMTMDQVVDLSYYRPDAFRPDLEHMPAAAKAAMAGNQAALKVYAGRGMTDPGLLDRLPSVTEPVLVVWGAADRMIPAEHGEAYAKAIPGARFLLLPETGHLPQLEAPDRLLAAIRDFVADSA